MLMAVIPVTSVAVCERLIRENDAKVDGFELRWDYAQDYSVSFIKKIGKLSSKPLIFTLRTKAQGGEFNGDLEQQWLVLQRLAAAKPTYLDLDFQMPDAWFEKINQDYPATQVILSMHVLAKDKLDWEQAYQVCSHLPHAIFKLAVYCHSGLDTLSFLEKIKAYSLAKPMTRIAMGENASFARVLGPWMDNYFDYAYVKGCFPQAPGQLSVDELLVVYRYRDMQPSTILYALLGSPIDGSMGHYFHNDQFEKLKKNAVYLKIPIEAHEVTLALKLTLLLNFQGLRITMPLKQEVAKRMRKHLSSVNTLKQVQGHWQAYNVDGIGALEAYQAHTKASSGPILLIGNGGAALAIREAFIQHGYQVYVLARNPKFGECADIKAFEWISFQGVINTIPAAAYLTDDAWIQQIWEILTPGMNVMDIVYQESSKFYEYAKAQNCQIIAGREMYYAQAYHQLKIWFNE